MHPFSRRLTSTFLAGELGARARVLEETEQNMKKKDQKSSLFLNDLAYCFPVFLLFLTISANVTTKYSKNPALRA